MADKPKGVIIFAGEPDKTIFAKWVAFVIVMCLIILIFIWFGFYFDRFECDLNRKDLQLASRYQHRHQHRH